MKQQTWLSPISRGKDRKYQNNKRAYWENREERLKVNAEYRAAHRCEINRKAREDQPRRTVYMKAYRARKKRQQETTRAKES